MNTTAKPDPATPPPTSSGLSLKEIAFLAKIQTGHWNLKDGKPSPGIQSLIDRGYCRTAKERLGPLGIYTGEVMITITEAAQNSIFPKDASAVPTST